MCTVMMSRRQKIRKANDAKDPFERIKNENYQCKDVEIKIECLRDLSSDLMEKCFELLVANMKEFYTKSSLGWKPDEKRKDLNADWARYLIARDASNDNLVGFSMFRFDMDYGKAVLYCYELQISSNYQGKGIGACLMKILGELAKAWQMEKVILTALANNKSSVKFYEKLNYTPDETSPDDENSYVILSKCL